jgi:hypothetical protein
MDLSEIEWGSMSWTDLAQGEDYWEGGGGACEHGSEPSDFIKCW